MKAVLYLRYSSHSQTEQSIEGQERICTEYCKRKGIAIVGKYIDRATSASKNTEKRVNFLQMIKDSAKHKWDAVVVYKLDRFSRNRYDNAIYKSALKKNKVRLLSATEEIGDTPESVILESVLEGINEYYSLELRQKVKRGMTESALKASSNGGRTPYGYKAVNKKYEINEEEAPVVREIFERFASGENTTRIIEDLTRRGITTRQGIPWQWSSMAVLLKNKKYQGDYHFEDVVIPNAIPPIVSKETFQTAQQRLGRSKGKTSRNINADYKLTGKVFCGHCGDRMAGCSGKTRKGVPFYYYACNSRRKGTCDASYVPRDKLEYIVVQTALEALSPETVDQLAESAANLSRKEFEENTELKRIQKEIDGVDFKINGLTEALPSSLPLVRDYLTGEINKLLTQKEDLQKTYEEEQKRILVLTKEQILAWFHLFMDGEVDDDRFRERVIDLLVESVTVWTDGDDGWKVRLIYKLTKNQTELRIPQNAPPNKFYSNHLVIEKKIARD